MYISGLDFFFNLNEIQTDICEHNFLLCRKMCENVPFLSISEKANIIEIIKSKYQETGDFIIRMPCSKFKHIGKNEGLFCCLSFSI
jgi:hypothetical protein